MNYADLRPIDTTNGSGIATSLFVSGCNFHCKGCFNKEAWDFNYGQPYTKETEDKLIEYAKNEHINHVSLLGGEVFHQDLDVILGLVKRIKKEVNKPIYIWTGFTWEQLIEDEKRKEVLQYVDVIIDGQFIEELKELDLYFRGSSNQRMINVKESLKNNILVLVD